MNAMVITQLMDIFRQYTHNTNAFHNRNCFIRYYKRNLASIDSHCRSLYVNIEFDFQFFFLTFSRETKSFENSRERPSSFVFILIGDEHFTFKQTHSHFSALIVTRSRNNQRTLDQITIG